MKKRIAAFFLIIFLCFTVSAAAYAQEESNIDSGNGLRLADMADLLQESEEKALLALLDEMSERQQLDIVVVTANTLNGKTPMEYADDFYDYNDYGFGAQKDGVLPFQTQNHNTGISSFVLCCQRQSRRRSMGIYTLVIQPK